ncbi:MAG: hypothetical protein D6704_04765 [Nitrospirae bacterium]|nr:MAG: hypothetical protein D6704_04765 [Nitrospirota bacterium]
MPSKQRNSQHILWHILALASMASLIAITPELARLGRWVASSVQISPAFAMMLQAIAWSGLAWMGVLAFSRDPANNALGMELATGFGLLGTVGGLVGMLDSGLSIRASLGSALYSTAVGISIALVARLRLRTTT